MCEYKQVMQKNITGKHFRTLVLPAFLRGIIPGVSKNVELPFGSYQTVAAFLTFINNAHITGLGIREGIEGMTDKVHL